MQHKHLHTNDSFLCIHTLQLLVFNNTQAFIFIFIIIHYTYILYIYIIYIIYIYYLLLTCSFEIVLLFYFIGSFA